MLSSFHIIDLFSTVSDSIWNREKVQNVTYTIVYKRKSRKVEELLQRWSKNITITQSRSRKNRPRVELIQYSWIWLEWISLTPIFWSVVCRQNKWENNGLSFSVSYLNITQYHRAALVSFMILGKTILFKDPATERSILLLT